MENKLNKIIKKPKIRKETNLPNSKINRLIIEKNDNYSDNMDDLDDVCNFSGINNISYTKKRQKDYKNDFFDDLFDKDFERARSPEPIFHKKIKMDFNDNNINKHKDKNNFKNDNSKERMNQLKNIQNEIKDINFADNKFHDNIQNPQIKNNNLEGNIKNENKERNINNNLNNNNLNKVSNNIYNSSQGYFSFKIKKNNNKGKDPIVEEKNEDGIDKNKYNESIMESVSSSKFNFKINDDIHESEFNDVDFLD